MLTFFSQPFVFILFLFIASSLRQGNSSRSINLLAVLGGIIFPEAVSILTYFLPFSPGGGDNVALIVILTTLVASSIYSRAATGNWLPIKAPMPYFFLGATLYLVLYFVTISQAFY